MSDTSTPPEPVSEPHASPLEARNGARFWFYCFIGLTTLAVVCLVLLWWEQSGAGME